MVDEFCKKEVYEHCININRKRRKEKKNRTKGEWEEKGNGGETFDRARDGESIEMQTEKR
jgi:hypothetical protein